MVSSLATHRRAAVALAALLVAAYCAAPIVAATTASTVVKVDKAADDNDMKTSDAPGGESQQPSADDQSNDDSTAAKPCGCAACQAKRQQAKPAPASGLDSLFQWPRASLFSDLDALMFSDRPLFRAPSWAADLLPRRLGPLLGDDMVPTGSTFTNVGIRTLASDADATVLGVRLPGVPRENLKVSVDAEGLLTVEGGYSEGTAEADKSSQDEGAARTAARHQFQFFAQQQLPFGVDASRVVADYKDGLLRVTVPKPQKDAVTHVSVA